MSKRPNENTVNMANSLAFDYLPVRSKKDFVRRYAAGEFGNAAPTWDNVASFLQQARPDRLYHVRNRVAGGPTWYNVLGRNVAGVWERACTQHNCRPDMLYISQMAPTERTLIQGEVQQGLHGLDLYYTTVARPMRDALVERSHRVEGVVASQLLRRYLCPNSYGWLMELLDRYVGHVVEFSTYAVEWGTLPGYNTVFWEVRQY